QELKQEVGLGHYEGRGWRGFHHHATLCIAAYGFLIAEQATIPPSGPRSAAPVQVPPLPDDYRPRGSALAACTACPELDRNHARATEKRPQQDNHTLPLLRRHRSITHAWKTHDAVRLAKGFCAVDLASQMRSRERRPLAEAARLASWPPPSPVRL